MLQNVTNPFHSIWTVLTQLLSPFSPLQTFEWFLFIRKLLFKNLQSRNVFLNDPSSLDSLGTEKKPLSAFKSPKAPVTDKNDFYWVTTFQTNLNFKVRMMVLVQFKKISPQQFQKSHEKLKHFTVGSFSLIKKHRGNYRNLNKKNYRLTATLKPTLSIIILIQFIKFLYNTIY